MTATDVRIAPEVRPSTVSGGTTLWRALLVLIPLTAAITVLLLHGRSFVGMDFDVYRGGGAAVLAGDPLYDYVSAFGLPFTYPPFAALIFTPMALVPPALGAAGWAALSLGAMEAVIWLVLGRLGVTGRLRWTAVTSLAMLPLCPIGFHLWTGQANMLLLLLVCFDMFGRTGRAHGVGIGLAAGIKLTPLVFIPYLLFTRRIRAAVTATVTFAGTILIGFAVLPSAAVQYWFGYLSDVSRVTRDGVPYFNSSIRGVLVQLGVPHLDVTYVVVAGIAGLLGFLVSVRAARRGHELMGVVACGLVSLLISPVSWLFHWVWLVPLLMMWAARAWRRDSIVEKAGVATVWLAATVSMYWAVLVFLLLPLPGVLTWLSANLYVGVGAVALVAFAVYLRVGSRLAR